MRRRLTCLAAAAALALGGCGGDDEETTSTTTTTEATTGTTGTTGATGATGAGGAADEKKEPGNEEKQAPEVEEIGTTLQENGYELIEEFTEDELSISDPQPLGGFNVHPEGSSSDSADDASVYLYKSEADAQKGADELDSDWTIEVVGSIRVAGQPITGDEKQAFEELVQLLEDQQ
jgi:hypothetical protein